MEKENETLYASHMTRRFSMWDTTPGSVIRGGRGMSIN